MIYRRKEGEVFKRIIEGHEESKREKRYWEIIKYIAE